MIDPDPSELKELAARARKENQKFFKKLRSRPPKDLDPVIHDLHEETFATLDCLSCANCCKTTGPLLTDKDIDRLAGHEKMKPGEFTQKYLRLDEDGDYVFKTMPCRYLGPDNYCSIYEIRPKACREYPHTDRRKQAQILDITRQNVSVCPAIYRIVERLKAHYS